MAAFTTGNKIKFTSGAGIFAGVLLSDHFTTTIKGPPASTSTSKSNSSKSFNFGFSAAAGIQIPIAAKLKFDIGVHDNFGIANTLKSNAPYKSEIKTNAFSVMTGLTWRL
jgi:hypothetical protein